jgi:predicted membrane protein
VNLQREHVGLAVVLISVGIVLLLANLGLFDLDIGNVAGTWWPTIFVAYGLWRLLIDRSAGLLMPGFFIGLGLVFQVVALGWAGWGAMWPAILIVLGIVILLQGTTSRRRPSVEGEDTIDLSTMFGGIEQKISSGQFRGGRVSAIFGSIELDLRESRLAEDADLNVTALFGGVELKVPEDCDIQIHGSPLFGAIEDPKGWRGRQGSETGPALHIHASVTFGGVEIKR